MSSHPWSEGAETDDPLLLQIVVASDKARPAGLSDLLSAVATVVATARDRFAEEFAAYERQRIRKLVRHLPSAKVAGLASDPECLEAGVLLHDAPLVAVVGPLLRSATPRAVSKGQLGASEERFDDDLAECAVEHPGPSLVLAVNPTLSMSPLKLAAQVGHAAQLMHLRLTGTGAVNELEVWRAAGFATVVFRPRQSDWAGWRDADVTVTDAGFTEIPPGSHTVSGRFGL